jgi:hypothetical protein
MSAYPAWALKAIADLLLLFDPGDVLDLGEQLAWSKDRVAANVL